MIDAHMATLAAFGDIPPLYVLGPIGAVTALVMAFVFSRSVMSKSEGDDEMVRIAEAVRQGAMAYLVRQYKVVAGVFVALVLFLAILAFGLGLQPVLSIVGVPIAGLLSGLCGWFGMKMATNASARTANAAKESLNDGLRIAFRSGAVMGLVVVGFALLDVSVWFAVLNMFGERLGVPTMIDGQVNYGVMTTIMLSFGMGASTQALFARVGGGIYTKAADVGADLVGKVEAGIPEDDARNPATIADNVGDNVGDVAGMGADLYESYYGSILATMALGAAAAYSAADGMVASKLALLLATAPIALAGAGILCSIVGVFSVRAKEGATFAQLLAGLHRGVYIASGLIIVAAIGLLTVLLGGEYGLSHPQVSGAPSPLGVVGSIVSGLLAGLIIAYATEYYTSYEHEPTRRIARQAITGPATVIIAGIAEGMKSTWASLLTVTIAIIAAFTFSGGADNFLFGLYGVGIAAAPGHQRLEHRDARAGGHVVDDLVAADHLCPVQAKAAVAQREKPPLRPQIEREGQRGRGRDRQRQRRGARAQRPGQPRDDLLSGQAARPGLQRKAHHRLRHGQGRDAPRADAVHHRAARIGRAVAHAEDRPGQHHGHIVAQPPAAAELRHADRFGRLGAPGRHRKAESRLSAKRNTA
ncbi:MAG: sodium/proton-translocating pyrophosphatase [Phycisphaerales bacterium]